MYYYCFSFIFQKSIDNIKILWYHKLRFKERTTNTERYRSGYNGTVLKTVVRQRTVGSNPTLSATAGCMLNTARFLIKQRLNPLHLQKYSSW